MSFKDENPLIYSNPRLDVVVNDWPLGGAIRGFAYFSVELHPTKRQERGVRITVDPRNNKPGQPKKMTYAVKVRIVDGSDGKTYLIELSCYGHITVMQSNMKFQQEVIYSSDLRHADLLKLFAKPAEAG